MNLGDCIEHQRQHGSDNKVQNERIERAVTRERIAADRQWIMSASRQ